MEAFEKMMVQYQFRFLFLVAEYYNDGIFPNGLNPKDELVHNENKKTMEQFQFPLNFLRCHTSPSQLLGN